MTRVLIVTSICVVVVACIPIIGSVEPIGVITSAVTTTTIPSPSEPAQSGASEVLGLITATGVPVAVTASNSQWFWITTPCGFSRVIDEGTPLGEIPVVLDPGHGGPYYTGAVAPTGLVEKNVNLDLAKAAQDLLVGRGIATVLTRTGDYQSSLGVRSALADALHAEVLVSIHHNGPNQPRSEIPGTEVFFQQDSTESRRLGGLLWEHITRDLSVFDVDWAAAADSGVMPVIGPSGGDAYGMVRQPATTAVILEVGYMANPAEARLYATPAYIRVASIAIADAIQAFLTDDREGSGFSEPRHFLPHRGAYEDRCMDPALTTAEASATG